MLTIFARMGAPAVLVSEFLESIRSQNVTLIDSRSEKEYLHAHIPGAVNIPILNNEEREKVGSTFKKQGRDEAVSTGFQLVGPRFHDIIKQAKEAAPGRQVLLYCWRGGMRSQIMSWLLEMSGFRVTTLKGGYKAFRNHVLTGFTRRKNVIVLGGPTGSGKTELLNRIRNAGEQVLQLEELAHHKGSAFGGLGQLPQPSNEYFENRIGMEWEHFDPDRPVWIENESRSIGTCLVPDAIYTLIRTSHLVEIRVGDTNRRKRILEEYGIFPIPVLADTTRKIGKRLGPQHLKHALEMLEAGNLKGWLDVVLDYYDKLYAYGSNQRDPDKRHIINLEPIPGGDHASHLIAVAQQILQNEKLIT